MRGTTHLAAGLVASAVLAPGATGCALIVFGSLLSDIDTPASTISHRTTGLPGLFLEHRGITHSSPFTTVAACVSPYIAIGLITHMVLDMFNPSGIRIFWPLKYRLSLGSISTGGLLDSILGLTLFAGAILITAYKHGLL